MRVIEVQMVLLHHELLLALNIISLTLLFRGKAQINYFVRSLTFAALARRCLEIDCIRTLIPDRQSEGRLRGLVWQVLHRLFLLNQPLNARQGEVAGHLEQFDDLLKLGSVEHVQE